eukprot:3086048-Alexandrium_andersonii.AAC.1
MPEADRKAPTISHDSYQPASVGGIAENTFLAKKGCLSLGEEAVESFTKEPRDWASPKPEHWHQVAYRTRACLAEGADPEKLQ